MKVAMYLRKSRADLEAEQRGEGETLTKHKNALLKVADQQQLNIIAIKKELVSGESLIHRPEMLKLLREVEDGMYDAVLCMEIDRLGRGDMQEQGLILNTFKAAKTRIITPRKIYDLEDEFDEEYSEFEAFMARKEFKLITRRMQRGRIGSIEEGNYIGTRPPYGYTIKRNSKKERTLEAHPEQALVVQMIFTWYTQDHLGTGAIANKLNSLGYVSSTGKKWIAHSLLDMLKNPVYIGKVTWGKRKTTKSIEPGKKRHHRRLEKEDWLVVQGKHTGLISEEVFNKAQEILDTRYHVPYNNNGITNPLAGIITCGKCGYALIQRSQKDRKKTMDCKHKGCDTKGSYLDIIENRLLQALHQWLIHYPVDFSNQTYSPIHDIDPLKMKKDMLHHLQKEITDTEKQKDNLHTLLERGIYDSDTFSTRLTVITTHLQELQHTLIQIKKDYTAEQQRDSSKQQVAPSIQHILDLYKQTDDPLHKNNFLKSVLEKVVYTKDKTQRLDDFTLVLYPKLPYHENP